MLTKKTGVKEAAQKSLRWMKTTKNKVTKHAGKRKELLTLPGNKTDFYPGEIRQVQVRIDLVLKQLPAAKSKAINESFVSAD